MNVTFQLGDEVTGHDFRLYRQIALWETDPSVSAVWWLLQRGRFSPMLDLDDIAESIPSISVDAKYWFVRSNKGELYDAFIATHSIAISYKAISIDFIEPLDDSEASKEALKEEIRQYYPPKTADDGRTADLSGLAASQLLRFCKEMKRGDIVVVPSEGTQRLAIGTIDDDKPFEEVLRHGDEEYPDFNKRRSVNWIRGVDRTTINPNLFRLFLNQQTIVNATPYAHWINPLIYQIFRRGEDYHCVLRVDAAEHIRAQALFRSCIELFHLAGDFAKSEGSEISYEDVDTRINLNSPGDLEFWKHGFEAVLLLGLFVVLINGGGFDFKLGSDVKFSLKTEGLIKRISEFLNQQQNRKIAESVRKKLETLKVKNPEQLVELLKHIKK